mgnify:CR=1 FL=1
MGHNKSERVRTSQGGSERVKAGQNKSKRVRMLLDESAEAELVQRRTYCGMGFEHRMGGLSSSQDKINTRPSVKKTIGQ